MANNDEQEKPGTPNAEPPTDRLPNGESLDSTEAPTPLEQVRQQQAMQQESREALDAVENRDDIPGGSKPSDKRHHPQRQIYGGEDS